MPRRRRQPFRIARSAAAAACTCVVTGTVAALASRPGRQARALGGRAVATAAAPARPAPRWADPACAVAERAHDTPESDSVFVASVAPGLPPFCFWAVQLVPLPREQGIGYEEPRMDIYRPGEARVWQTLGMWDNAGAPARLSDWNGDGYLDLALVDFNGGNDVRYAHHVYDPRTGRFSLTDELDPKPEQ